MLTNYTAVANSVKNYDSIMQGLRSHRPHS